MMTLLVASIFAEDVADVESQSARAWVEGATAVEVRADTFHDPPQRLAGYLRAHSERAWIVTCRCRSEGGRSAQTAEQRASFLADAVAGAWAFVDFEFADWEQCQVVRDRLSEALRSPVGVAPRLILSAHDLQSQPDNLGQLVDRMLAVPNVAAAKVAYPAEHITDSFDALDLMRRYGRRVIAIAMGEDGLWTRVLAKKLSAFATYCALDRESATAPGQPTIAEMFEHFRWPELGSGTQLLGVIGDPVGHSMSPLLHNGWLADAGVDGVYLPLLVGRKGDCVRRFLDQCRQRPWLTLRGLSVTTPHKTSALHWVGDGAEWLAGRLGAANTLVFSDAGATAYNTDCYAAVDSLCAALGCTRPQLHGLTVDVLGNGGTARALVYALPMFGCRVTAYGRSFDRTRRTAEELQAHAAPWEERAAGRGEVLINATSVGMWPAVDESPMPAEGVRNRRLVFDVIYNPLETRLLQEAAGAGVKTLNGLDMFLRQAAMQFELWTGRYPDTGSVRALIENAITTKPRASARPNDLVFKTGRHLGGRQSIALIGLRGSGKTTVGRELAALLSVPFIDTDELVAAEAGKSVAEIFQAEGEAGFRVRERWAVAKALKTIPAVISVGGGAILDPSNVTALRQSATAIWLTAPPDVLFQRITADAATAASRPALTNLEGPHELEHLLRERRTHYESAADWSVDTTDRSPVEIARELVARINR